VVADEADAAVGFTQVVGIDERSRHGAFGIAIAPEHRVVATAAPRSNTSSPPRGPTAGSTS